MCGIAGIIGHRSFVQEPILETMAKGLAHRGPDDEGVEVIQVDVEKNCCLGLAHRRLSIIDLSKTGHQPMCNEDGTIWITYNGEIYNFMEIRDALKIKGYKFKSNSDTEVVVCAYEEWGLECLQQFQGMFAFAIWDQKKKLLFLAVDRFGIKPLYFHKSRKELFLFSSEVRALLDSGLTEKKIEPMAVDSFLSYGAVQAPLTLIKEVYSLLPAHYLAYNFQTCEMNIVQYWSPSDNLSNKPLNDEAETIEKLRGILQNTIKKHLVSDVPVGLFLSGGIDSSAIVAIANTFAEGSLHSFSVTFSESAFSEGKYSQLIADRYCKNHTEIKLSAEDLLSFLPLAIKAMDQPTINGINTYAISKVVRKNGIKVVLSGQGGDEVFGGYPTFRRIPIIKGIYNLVKPLPFSMRKTIGHTIDILGRRGMIGSKLSQILESDGDTLSLYLILRQLFSAKARKYLTGKNYGGKLANGIPLQVVQSLTKEMKELDNTFSEVSILELRLYLSNMLLRDGDFMSMAHGLEVRVPFLDHEIVEFVFNVSSRVKLRNNLPKPLLVKAMGELLPKEVYSRPKMGFTFPWEVWLKNQLHAQMEDLIYGCPENSEIGLNMKNCQYLWKMFLQDSSGVTWARVWAIYVLLCWCRENGIE